MKTYTFTQRMEVEVTFEIKTDDEFDPTNLDQIDCTVTVDALSDDNYKVDLQLVEYVIVTGFEITDGIVEGVDA